MVGKFFLIAFLCVFLTQAQGNELGESIKKGLSKVNGMYEDGQKKINASIEAVAYKNKVVEGKTMQFVINSVTVRDGTKQALREVAQAMEEKGKESNKPESVFVCIKNAEKNANQQIQILTDKFKVNMTNQEKVTLTRIQTESKPLVGMQEPLKVQHQKVVKTIQSCKTVSCVDTAVSSCAKYLEQMNADIGKIMNQVGSTVGNYEKDASNYFRNHVRQVDRVKSEGIRDIKKCVMG